MGSYSKVWVIQLVAAGFMVGQQSVGLGPVVQHVGMCRSRFVVVGKRLLPASHFFRVLSSSYPHVVTNVGLRELVVRTISSWQGLVLRGRTTERARFARDAARRVIWTSSCVPAPIFRAGAIGAKRGSPSLALDAALVHTP
jgi:hypothetical protein